jgi:zinc protease
MPVLNPSRTRAAEPAGSYPRHVGRLPFGPALAIDRYEFDNGLNILLCEDHSAPVIAYHTWFSVGSRHEREGKTGLAHLFEHLMFNETEHHPAGEFDRLLEEAGAESNAATWLDWTQYTINIPREALDLVVSLEADRMTNLVLRRPQVESEKEVVANERRYRVEDDVEGSVSELLYKTAFDRHAYRWPTIGWMSDIEGFTSEDCAAFYRTYYAPNNATLVVVGDVTAAELLAKVSAQYGPLPPAPLPVEDVQPEPDQAEERRLEVKKPTPTEKVTLGYKSPAFGDADYVPLSLLFEILFGGRASRVHKRLVRELELAADVRGFVSPFRDPGLAEVFASAREGVRAEALLDVIDAEIERSIREPVNSEELERARARSELSLLAGLETVDGKASTIGFHEVVIGRPAGAFDRLEDCRRATQSDLLRAARRHLRKDRRSGIVVRSDLPRREAP